MPGTVQSNHSRIIDPGFIAQARSWMGAPEGQFIGYLWSAYDDLKNSTAQIDGRDLERSITQLLEPRVAKQLSGDEPYYIQHSPFERETMRAPPAQPPEYDLAFVLRAEERIMWPMEAKVLETSGSVGAYVRDVRDEFLTCRYAPFSGSGAMLGYLLTGSPSDALDAIGESLSVDLDQVENRSPDTSRSSKHYRTVPAGKPYPADFCCYHLLMEFPGLERTR